MKKTKKVVSLLLSLIMLLSITAGLSISVNAEQNGDFEYTVLDDGTAEITGYIGSATDIIIPEVIDGYTVTGIGDLAFNNCNFITCIAIPDSVTRIGYGAFKSCTNLTGKIIIPDSVKSIGVNAFYCAKNIEIIVIGSGLEKITYSDGSEADDFYKSISMVLPHGMMVNHQLSAIEVSEQNKYLSSEDGVLFNKDKSVLLMYPDSKNTSTYYVPETVKKIAQDAFVSTEKLNNVILPESVETIDDCAFFFTSLDNLVVLNKDCIIGESNYFYDEDIFATQTAFIGYENSTIQRYAEDIGADFFALDAYDCSNNNHYYIDDKCVVCGLFADESVSNQDGAIISEGTDTKYIIGSEKGATIHCAYDLADFISVSVNGEIVDESNYTLEEGSTILTFLPSYLDTLAPGEYEVVLTYVNGTAATTLTVLDDTDSDEPVAASIDTAQNVKDNAEQNKAKSATQSGASKKSPSTGAPIASIAFAAAFAAGGLAVLIKKKTEE